MKKLLTLTLVLFLIGQVSANLIEFTDKFDGGNVKVNVFNPVFWEFDLTDDGFNPQNVELTSASVDLVLKDDNDRWLELGLFVVGNSGKWFWKAEDINVDLNISSLSSLNEDGKIKSSLFSAMGDFFLSSATLTATGEEQQVPESSIISLMGFGLLCLGGIKIRKKMTK